MTARSYINGHPVEFQDEWVHTDDGSTVYGSDGSTAYESERACAFCGEKPEIMKVVIPANLSYTGTDRLKDVQIDYCIAPLVKALNQGNIPTVASCCGHGRISGVISLQDGRELVIMSIEEREKYFTETYRIIDEELIKD